MATATRTLLFVSALLFFPAGAAAQVSVLDRTLQERNAVPGEVYDGNIVVTNMADEPHEVRLYQTDYRFHADGRNEFGTPGSVPRSNAPWITFSPSFVTIPPRSEVTVQYRVSVPAGEDRPLSGSYWSVIMVEPIAPGSPESAKAAPDRQGMGISTRIRYGIQIVTHIAGTGEVRYDFADPAIQVDPDGRRTVMVDLHNVGERSTALEIQLELYDAAGSHIRDLQDRERIVHPGTSIRKRFDLGVLAPGTYQALITADTGTEIFGAQYTLRF